MDDAQQHELLIQAGLDLHEARKYADALPYFQRALAATPHCVAAQYNVANTLHMLGHHDESAQMLQTLLRTPDEEFRAGCPLEENPRAFKNDALYLMFLTTLYGTGDWNAAFPYAEQHLSSRRRGLHSVWTVDQVRSEIENLRSQFAAS